MRQWYVHETWQTHIYPAFIKESEITSQRVSAFSANRILSLNVKSRKIHLAKSKDPIPCDYFYIPSNWQIICAGNEISSHEGR